MTGGGAAPPALGAAWQLVGWRVLGEDGWRPVAGRIAPVEAERLGQARQAQVRRRVDGGRELLEARAMGGRS